MAFVIRIPRSMGTSPRFSKYILAKLINDVSDGLRNSRYKFIDDYVNSYAGSTEHISSASLISYYVRTFTIREGSKYISIGDNDRSERVLNSDRKIYDVVRLIEYGSRVSPAIPKLVTCIDNIQNNLDKIYKNWLEISGG